MVAFQGIIQTEIIGHFVSQHLLLLETLSTSVFAMMHKIIRTLSVFRQSEYKTNYMYIIHIDIYIYNEK